MIKCKVLDIKDRDLDEVGGKHVIIERDEEGVDPLHDWEQVFLLHSNIPREFCGNEHDKGYEDPLVELEDEDGYGTGKFTFREGVMAFPVSAYIHSGIVLSLGTTREFWCDPGGWDTTPNAAYLWTDKERFERLCGPWMEVYDEETKSRRQAKDEAEFREYLRGIAESELEDLQKCIDGEVFWYQEQTAKPYTKTYRDGTVKECVEWEDGDSCCGFVVDKVGDIDFPKEVGWKVFDATGYFVGDEYDIPEFVIKSPVSGLYLMAEGSKDSDAEWTSDLSKAKVFHCWNWAYNALLQPGKRLWSLPEYVKNDVHDVIKDKDELQ